MGAVECGLNMDVGVLSPEKKTPSWTYPFGCGPTQLTDLVRTLFFNFSKTILKPLENLLFYIMAPLFFIFSILKLRSFVTLGF